ncbi:hypothetical protein BJ138DRAFT_1113555 [Hygrophoropsis aurantiaca]|uniref:Uncharacterized protein n=1 Tax=Hygrophoropsis aurantiaca TaxID=72124 RepID=A0ACB8AE91_9AGAM|nr:hypothetical protein BJ138DRAFT_1113555 [Hygrophoropsis aurantiaca]
MTHSAVFLFTVPVQFFVGGVHAMATLAEIVTWGKSLHLNEPLSYPLFRAANDVSLSQYNSAFEISQS